MHRAFWLLTPVGGFLEHGNFCAWRHWNAPRRVGWRCKPPEHPPPAPPFSAREINARWIGLRAYSRATATWTRAFNGARQAAAQHAETGNSTSEFPVHLMFFSRYSPIRSQSQACCVCVYRHHATQEAESDEAPRCHVHGAQFVRGACASLASRPSTQLHAGVIWQTGH